MNRQARNDHCSEEDAEQFYQSFWSSPQWGAAKPNDDELSRLNAIIDLLNDCVLGGRPQILDLGCGRGWLSKRLAEWGDVLGTDIVGASIERARELFPDLSFEQIDISGLMDAHGTESFDLVVSSEVIEHVKGPQKRDFVDGIRQLLKPNGYAIITTPRGELWAAWQRHNNWEQPVEEWISETDLDDMATSIGLRVERRTRAHVYGITPLSRVFASSFFRSWTRVFPVLEPMTYASRIYQVVLLRRP